MASRKAWPLLSADCIQGALCSRRLQYFPSGRGKPASPELRKVTLVSELVGVQSQLCLETTHVPFPLLYDCSVNFQANACKLKLKQPHNIDIYWALPVEASWQCGHGRCCFCTGGLEAHSFQTSCTTLELGWRSLFEQDRIQICLYSTHTERNRRFSSGSAELVPKTNKRCCNIICGRLLQGWVGSWGFILPYLASCKIKAISFTF